MDQPLANLLFEYPGADIILRSQDSHEFRIPKSYVINNSPVFDKLIREALGSPHDAYDEASLPVVQLPESGAIIHNLLTFIFPVIPLVPSTTEKAMELLSVAQKYQMDSILTHIRLRITRYNPPPTQRDTALYMYSLAQRYGLRQEALQAARTILNYPMSIKDLEDKLDVTSSASLYELWKYSENVRANLASDLTDFRTSGARGTLTGLQCVAFSSSPSQIPRWLDDYIASIGDAPNCFEVFEFNTALAHHVSGSQNQRCKCGSISSETIRNFWKALTSAVDASFEKACIIDVHGPLTMLMSLQAESALSLVRERDDPQAQVVPTVSVPEALDVPDANLIIQSSDLVNFRVHKSVLTMASPVFRDLFSLHQPSGSESVDGLPVVKLTEDAELLNSLFSVLYPVHLAIPSSYEKLLYLLSACQKYDMDQVQSVIRAEVKRGGSPSPVGTEVFRAYAIASGKRLTPEMENAARLTLDHPMTFETLGEGLRLFEGSALQDLVRFRERCRDNLVTCLQSFLDLSKPPFNIWTSCRTSYDNLYPYSNTQSQTGCAPPWLTNFFRQRITELDQAFTKPFPNPSKIREEYMSALQAHTTSSSNGNVSCVACAVVHAMKGETFCKELDNRLVQTISKVGKPFMFVGGFRESQHSLSLYMISVWLITSLQLALVRIGDQFSLTLLICNFSKSLS
jgi:BTB/POZ domain